MEIERKWLFDGEHVPFDIPILEKGDYWQAYLSIDPEVRIRKKLKSGSDKSTYKLCIKSKGELDRIEVELDLLEMQFLLIMDAANLSLDDFITKKLIIYNVSGHELALGRVDIGKDTSFCYGEIEFPSVEKANAFIAPSWFGEEVTNNSFYRMANYWERTRKKEV